MNYHDQVNKENIEKLRELLATLPSFCKMYFRGMNDTMASRTKIAYAYDLRVFFEFLHKNNSEVSKYEMKDIPITILDRVSREDVEEYMEYLSFYKNDNEDDVLND